MLERWSSALLALRLAEPQSPPEPELRIPAAAAVGPDYRNCFKWSSKFSLLLFENHERDTYC